MLLPRRPVSLLIVSPTAMGLMSGGQLGFTLFNAVIFAPPKNWATFNRNFPEGKRLIMLLREAQ